MLKIITKKENGGVSIRDMAIVSIIVLLLLLSISLIPFTKAHENGFCPVDVDAVLVMDTSRTMADGGSPSKCEWCEIKWYPEGSTNTWFLNTKYNETSEWCGTVRNQFDETEVYFQPCDPTYTPAKNSKIEDAKIAASSFLDNLKTADQSALVSFNDIANLVKNLSQDHSATKTGVNNLTSGSTNASDIGNSIAKASEELNSERANPLANKVIILLTDGKANKPNGYGYGEDPVDVAYAQEKAQEAANLGYKIFTIGLGDNINPEMLQNIANITSGQYYYASDSAQLTGIYNQIYSQISQGPCQSSSISGCKWLDANNNGIWEETETELLSEWEIVLNGPVNLTQTTSATGCYEFSGLAPGSYTLTETLKPGWTQTYPLGGSHSVNITDWNQHLQEYHFGNYLPDGNNGNGNNGQPSPQADLSVTKIVDDNTVDPGQTIVFTIGVTNIGPDVAPGVILNDFLLSGLTFFSASSTLGVYATSTGAWVIGDLAKDASAVLEIKTIVQGQAGAIITNNATSSLTIDPLSSNNSASVTITINTPGTTPPSSGGGGGGGGGESAYSLLNADAQRVDANRDGKIDILDFNILMIHWGEIGMGVGDFNGDGKVDIIDFDLLMIYWAG